MNEPIISPWVFYLINLFNNVLWLFGLVAILSIITCAGYIVVGLCIYDAAYKEEKEEFAKKAIRIFKYIFATLIVSCVITIFVPSSDTIYKMLVASQVTPHNIEVMGDTVENSIDYIFEKIQSLDDTEESEEE